MDRTDAAKAYLLLEAGPIVLVTTTHRGRHGIGDCGQQTAVAAGRIENAKGAGNRPCGSSRDLGQKIRQHRGRVMDAVRLRVVRCFFSGSHGVDYK